MTVYVWFKPGITVRGHGLLEMRDIEDIFPDSQFLVFRPYNLNSEKYTIDKDSIALYTTKNEITDKIKTELGKPVVKERIK